MGVVMNLAQALKRIAELEQRIAKLEAAPKQEIHYHQHHSPIVPHFDTVPVPTYPAPYSPWPQRYEITCGANS